jgi:hypothetical protein
MSTSERSRSTMEDLLREQLGDAFDSDGNAVDSSALRPSDEFLREVEDNQPSIVEVLANTMGLSNPLTILLAVLIAISGVANVALGNGWAGNLLELTPLTAVQEVSKSAPRGSTGGGGVLGSGEAPTAGVLFAEDFLSAISNSDANGEQLAGQGPELGSASVAAGIKNELDEAQPSIQEMREVLQALPDDVLREILGGEEPMEGIGLEGRFDGLAAAGATPSQAPDKRKAQERPVVPKTRLQTSDFQEALSKLKR